MQHAKFCSLVKFFDTYFGGIGMGILLLFVFVILLISIICAVRLNRSKKELIMQNDILKKELADNNDKLLKISEALDSVKNESRRVADIFTAAEMLMFMSDGAHELHKKHMRQYYDQDDESERLKDDANEVNLNAEESSLSGVAGDFSDVGSILSEDDIETLIKD